jgi:hypothetical protein
MLLASERKETKEREERKGNKKEVALYQMEDDFY